MSPKVLLVLFLVVVLCVPSSGAGASSRGPSDNGWNWESVASVSQTVLAAPQGTPLRRANGTVELFFASSSQGSTQSGIYLVKIRPDGTVSAPIYTLISEDDGRIVNLDATLVFRGQTVDPNIALLVYEVTSATGNSVKVAMINTNTGTVIGSGAVAITNDEPEPLKPRITSWEGTNWAVVYAKEGDAYWHRATSLAALWWLPKVLWNSPMGTETVVAVDADGRRIGVVTRDSQGFHNVRACTTDTAPPSCPFVWTNEDYEVDGDWLFNDVSVGMFGAEDFGLVVQVQDEDECRTYSVVAQEEEQPIFWANASCSNHHVGWDYMPESTDMASLFEAPDNQGEQGIGYLFYNGDAVVETDYASLFASDDYPRVYYNDGTGEFCALVFYQGNGLYRACREMPATVTPQLELYLPMIIKN